MRKITLLVALLVGLLIQLPSVEARTDQGFAESDDFVAVSSRRQRNHRYNRRYNRYNRRHNRRYNNYSSRHRYNRRYNRYNRRYRRNQHRYYRRDSRRRYY